MFPKTKKYIYPKLPATYCCLPNFRIGGNGLANCLFVAAKAYVRAKRDGLELIEPTWLNFSIGPYLRREKDKRHYAGLFRPYGKNYGWRKFLLLTCCRSRIVTVEGIKGHFEEILADSQTVREYLLKIVKPELLTEVDHFDFRNTVAVHIRLGDYPQWRRTPLDWYAARIADCRAAAGDRALRFLIFSDGTDQELEPFFRHKDTQRVFFGSAIADIFAISRCPFLIGSDSTFSGWGAYLGQVPSVFYRKHYGRLLNDPSMEIVDCSGEKAPPCQERTAELFRRSCRQTATANTTTQTSCTTHE